LAEKISSKKNWKVEERSSANNCDVQIFFLSCDFLNRYTEIHVCYVTGGKYMLRCITIATDSVPHQ